jgi:hypothetical protein
VTEPGQTASHEELVEHMLRAMERQGLEIEAASTGGHAKPKRIRPGLKRTRLRADVVARDGRRTVIGIALDSRLIREGYVPRDLDAYAGACRMLVICIDQACAGQAIHVLFDKPMPNWRKMRLLRRPGTELEDVSKASNEKRRQALVRARRHAPVHVLSDED